MSRTFSRVLVWFWLTVLTVTLAFGATAVLLAYLASRAFVEAGASCWTHNICA
jgi:hypothetical protein